MDITQIDAQSVNAVLVAFARSRGERGTGVEPTDPQLVPALQELVAEERRCETSVSREELARAALALLVDDPTHGPEVRSALAGPRPESFGVVTTAAVLTAVVLVLQTHVRFERRPDGKWTLKIEKKPTTPSLLQSLLAKLAGFLGNMPRLPPPGGGP